MVTISCEDCIAQDTVEIAYGRIVDLSGVEMIIRVCSVVGEAMPKVEKLFSKVVGYTEMGTFLSAEIKQLSERVLRELVFGTKYAKLHDTRKLVSGTRRSDVAEGTEELESECLVNGLGLAAQAPQIDTLKKALNTFKQTKVPQTVSINIPSGV